MVQKGPDGPKRVPNDQKDLGWPFWSLLDPFGQLWTIDKPAMFGHFWAMNGGPQSKKKAHHKVSYVLFACRTPKDTVWNMNMAVFYEKCQK